MYSKNRVTALKILYYTCLASSSSINSNENDVFTY